MTSSLRTIALAGGCLLAGTIGFAVQQQDATESGRKVAEQIRGAMESPEAMARWQETLHTGPAHQFLADAFKGEWNLEMKMWMDPAGDPLVSQGTATVEPILGGRFIRERVKANLMGQPWEGEGTTGYDNNRKLFVSSFIDSMTTGIALMKGSISPDGKTLTFFGDMDEPMSGEIGKPIKMVITVDSKDQHTMRMYEVLYGDEFKVMELVYTRRGS